MRSSKYVLLSLAVILLSQSSATAQAVDAGADLSANAALLYWQAFSQLPTLDKDQEKILEDWNKAPLDAAALKVISASQNSLMYLHRAAKSPRCDWGLDYNDGVGLLLPHLAKARSLARLAGLHARHEFEQGHWKAGREDAISMMMLARHVGRDPIMISILVGFNIEDMAIDLVAPYVPDVKAPFPQAVTTLESLPKPATFKQTLATEKKFMAEWIVNKLKDAEQTKKGSWREVWKNMVGGSEEQAAVPEFNTLDEVVDLMEKLIPVYDELGMMVELSKDEFDAKYPAFKQKTKAANPLAGLLLPAVDKLVAKQRRLQARTAMLLAGIAVAQDGPDKLKDIRDPFSDGPFEYKKLDKGFELKSKLLYDDQPVRLTIGGRKG